MKYVILLSQQAAISKISQVIVEAWVSDILLCLILNTSLVA